MTELTRMADRLPSFVQQWMDRALATTPLTDSEWQAWAAGMRGGYQNAGYAWPGVVVRVGTPIVAAQAACIALRVLRRLRRRTTSPSSAAIDTAVIAVMGSTVDPRFRSAVQTAVCAAVRGALEAFPGGHPRTGPRRPIWVELPPAPTPKALHAAIGREVYQIVWGLCMTLQLAVDFGFDLRLDRAVGASIPWQWRPDTILRFHSWAAFAAFFRDEVHLLPPDGELWQHSRAHQDAHLTRWWWPTRDFVMVCDRPVELHTETLAGRPRLHNDSGPAIRWADGWALYFWHHTPVPADLIEDGWSIEQILAEPNAEIRRCAIERMGWHQFATAAELELLDQTPDPANPGQWLRLYDVPRTAFGRQERVLLCTNATRERDGTRHRFGLTVPAGCRTALAAAAWTFDIPESDYATLARAT